jgi:hypothetical protein
MGIIEGAKSCLLFLFVDKLGVLWLVRYRALLARKVPVVQVAAPCRQIGCEAKPTEVGSESPCSNLVNLAPDVGKVSGNAGQSDNVDGSGNGTLHGEEEGHPGEVENQLDGVEGCALL